MGDIWSNCSFDLSHNCAQCSKNEKKFFHELDSRKKNKVLQFLFNEPRTSVVLSNCTFFQMWKVISQNFFCTFLDFSKIAMYCVWSNEWVVFCCCQRDFEIFLTGTTVKWLNCWGGGGKKCRATTYIQGRNYFFHSTLFRVNFLEFLSQKIRF